MKKDSPMRVASRLPPTVVGRLWTWCRLRTRDERGVSVVELIVTTMVMGIVGVVFINVLLSVQTGVGREQTRSMTNDEMRLAIEQLDREIRSGNKIYPPQSETLANFSLRVYTQANGTTRTPPNQCVQWKIENRNLYRRSYHVVGGVASVIAPWRVIAEGIVNRNVTPTVPAFAVNPTGRILDITLLGNSKLSDVNSPTVRVETTIAIRNSATGDPCTPIPSG